MHDEEKRREMSYEIENTDMSAEQLPEYDFDDMRLFEDDFMVEFGEIPEDAELEKLIFEETPQEKEDEQEEEAFEVVKRKVSIKVERGKNTGCIGALLFFAFVVGVSIVIASVGWIAARDVLALGKEEIQATIEIEESDTLDDITDKLYDAGIIEHKWLFKIYGKYSDAESKITAGIYDLNTTLDYRAIVTTMRTIEAAETVFVTIPEGSEMRDIFALLEEKGVAPAEDLWDAAANEQFDYDFLEGLPTGEASRLEGYLFPDTYEFYVGESAKSAIGRLLSNFNTRFSEELRAAASEAGYTMHEIVIIASLIEKEAANDSERATIASVIYNRLGSSYQYLEIDATVQYALEERKEELTYADLEIDSPYNTYKYPGLPVGPIASPGLESIRGAIYPESTPYFYYALDNDGTHHFSETYEEHQQFLRERDAE